MTKKELKRIKIKNKKEDIFREFKKLGWTFRHHGAGFYNFITPDGKELPIQIWFGSTGGDIPVNVEYDFDNSRGSMCFIFYTQRVFFEWINDDCISLTTTMKNTPVFINFSNYDLR